MFDLAILFILCLSLFVSFLRGFIKESFGIAGLVITSIVTLNYYDYFTDKYETHIHSGLIANLLSAISVFIIIIIAVIIINSWIMYLLSPIRLGILDRFGGLLIGLFRGIIISLILFSVIQLFYFTFTPADENSEKEANQHQNEEKEKILLPEWLIRSRSYETLNYIYHNIDEIIPSSFYHRLSELGQELQEMSGPKVDASGDIKTKSAVHNDKDKDAEHEN